MAEVIAYKARYEVEEEIVPCEGEEEEGAQEDGGGDGSEDESGGE